MKTINTTLALSALAVAILATPALAAKRHVIYQGDSIYPGDSSVGSGQTVVGTYPNGAIRSGSAASREAGNEDNVIR
jgi:hypothetical protein